MKTLVYKFILILAFIIPLQVTTYAQTNFFNEDCSTTLQIEGACIGDQQTITDINVSGIQTLGVNNFGIIEVYIGFNTTESFFNSYFILEAPNGDEYTIASYFDNSFQNWQGNEGVGVTFVPCLDYPTTTQAGSSIAGETFQPIDDYSELNDNMINPNGVWRLKACITTGETFNITCVRLGFDNICPETETVLIINPECAGEETQIIFDVNPGICPGIWASVDNINYNSYSQQDNELFTTNTDANILYIADSQSGTGQNSGCLPTETPISIEPTDSEFPTFLCPDDQTLSVDELCEATTIVTDPDLFDNCSGVSGTVTNSTTGDLITNIDLFLNQVYPIAPGFQFTYEFEGTGTLIIDWVVFDEAGNTVSCQQVIVIEDNTTPVWTQSDDIIINAECGVDDIQQIVADNISQLTGTDNCSETSLLFDQNTIQSLCGSSKYDDWYYFLVDESGNQTSNTIGILINYLDYTPPVITGMNQADITISCNEDLPTMPQIGVDVFSNDACQGDITSEMTLSSSSTFGDCLVGQPEEVITYVYTSIDGCGNEATESFTITIMNDVAPEFDAPFNNGNITLTATCGVDDLDAIIAANIPTASGCNGAATITVSSETEGSLCDATGGANSSSNTVISYIAEDDCGNTAFVALTIDYYDFTPPTINGIPADITLNCNDEVPFFPTITASDACAGDVTDLIEYSFSTSALSCSINQNAFVETHIWSAIDFCDNIQEATWTVTVFNDEAIELGDDITACTGATVVINSSGLVGDYMWSTGETTSGITVITAGTYSVTVTGESGCCSEDNITVVYQDFPDATANGGTLDCSGSDITIMGSSTTSGVDYSWSGPGGFSSTDQNPSVNQAGVYTLSVSTSAGCTTTDEAIVEADTDVPNITTNGGTIDCVTSQVTISGSSNTAGVTYAWSGPNGFSSSDQEPQVTVPGDYVLVITAPNGCIAEGLAVVEDDTEIPTSTAVGGTIDCDNATVTLTASSSDANATYQWTGPNGFSSNTQNPIVDVAGSYSLTVMSDNGCSSTVSTDVNEDIEVPNLTANGGTIDCTNSEVQLTSSSSTAGVTYQWTGPNGFSSTMANPTVDLAGEYTITVEAANGCSSATSVTIEEDIAIPTVSVDSDEIDCANTTVTLMPEATDGVAFAWTGPGGFMSADENPIIAEAGEYTVEVMAANGCTATTDVMVTEDISVPQVTVADGIIDCTNPMIELSLTTSTNDVTFAWTGPNNFSSDVQNPEVGDAGDYIVTTTGQNGCSVQNTISVSQDIATPTASAIGGEINCDANTVQIMGSSTTADVTFNWTGPNDYASSTQNPDVGSPGTYTLTVMGANGCTKTATAEVTADENLPNISASGGILDCNSTEVQLMGNSTTQGVSFGWTGPGGFESTEQNPSVNSAGAYTLSVTSDNGCVSETEVTVTLDNNEPTVIALGGVISCSSSAINLVGNSNDEVDYDWSGPGGFVSQEQNPEVTLPGDYTLTVTGTNGCTNTTTVQVTIDDDLPVATLGLPTIDCDDNSISVSVEATQDYSYEWTLDGNIISLNESVTISLAGDYSVMITSDNGCSVTLSYTLDQDIEALLADITTTDATSSEGGTAEIVTSNPGFVANILWDNGQTGNMVTDLSVGIHTVTVTNLLGCMYTFTFEVMMSTSVSEIDILEDFLIYPTIAQNFINIEAGLSESKEYSIQIIDIQGRLLFKNSYKSASMINERVSIDDLNSGVYIISFIVDDEMKTTKFIKM